jgi:hypothetical protein
VKKKTHCISPFHRQNPYIFILTSWQLQQQCNHQSAYCSNTTAITIDGGDVVGYRPWPNCGRNATIRTLQATFGLGRLLLYKRLCRLSRIHPLQMLLVRLERYSTAEFDLKLKFEI